MFPPRVFSTPGFFMLLWLLWLALDVSGCVWGVSGWIWSVCGACVVRVWAFSGTSGTRPATYRHAQTHPGAPRHAQTRPGAPRCVQPRLGRVWVGLGRVWGVSGACLVRVWAFSDASGTRPATHRRAQTRPGAPRPAQTRPGAPRCVPSGQNTPGRRPRAGAARARRRTGARAPRGGPTLPSGAARARRRPAAKAPKRRLEAPERSCGKELRLFEWMELRLFEWREFKVNVLLGRSLGCLNGWSLGFLNGGSLGFNVL